VWRPIRALAGLVLLPNVEQHQAALPQTARERAQHGVSFGIGGHVVEHAPADDRLIDRPNLQRTQIDLENPRGGASTSCLLKKFARGVSEVDAVTPRGQGSGMAARSASGIKDGCARQA
jgi:hypothetical protein